MVRQRTHNEETKSIEKAPPITREDGKVTLSDGTVVDLSGAKLKTIPIKR